MAALARIRSIILHPTKSAIRNLHEGNSKSYFDKRVEAVQALKSAGTNLYPYNSESTLSIEEFISSYQGKKGLDLSHLMESVRGRVLSVRKRSQISFYDLYQNGYRLQVYDSSGKNAVQSGDILGVTGHPGFTNIGYLTIYASKVAILCPCLRQLPKPKDKNSATLAAGKSREINKYMMKEETRYRQRYLDMMINTEVMKILKTRCRIIAYIRHFLSDRGFLEVETPIMSLAPSGGPAQAYKIVNDDSKRELYLRIAPELHLKELLVGGFEKVFEIGKQFRNEGIDSTHYPEFTSCEFYVAYEDVEGLMKLTEEMLSGLVMEITGGLILEYHSDGLHEDPVKIDFTPPFRRVDMIEELERVAQISIPRPFSGSEARAFLQAHSKTCNIKFGPEARTARLLDKLVGHYLEKSIVSPTFITNHPVVMSPMAKEHRSRPDRTERFELYIDKRELCNAYTELNDPFEQRRRFDEQAKLVGAGDNGEMSINDGYCRALEYGLPPCAGWGIGLDRLTMLLTDTQNIKEVIAFTRTT